MKLMVIGSGGREHAVIRKLRENPAVEKIYALPGNGGIAADAVCVDVGAKDIDGAVRFARENAVDFAVVTPDDPLVLGMVDALEDAGVPCFGPRKNAAIIEGSKVFSKNLMKKYGIPTAAYQVFDDAEAALAYVQTAPLPTVVKADGLALGKEVLPGPEVSVLVFTDGGTVKPMVSSMDHKRAHDGDEGLNTGGMGTVAPNPYYTKDVADVCMQTIFKPTIAAMAAEGRPFKGCLYFGLMLTPDGPKVIEYNCRFGDPETQVVLPLMESDLLTAMMACRNGTLAQTDIRFSDRNACCVIMASEGYPAGYEKGYEITRDGGVSAQVYVAGAKLAEGKLLTNGGRVLGVTAVADTLPEAIRAAYANVEKIHFGNAFYRRDIGQRALKALKN